MAVTSKPKSYKGDLSSTLTTVHNAPGAVPSDWGAGYASGQLKHLTICNGSTAATATVYVTVGGKLFLNWYSIAPGDAFDWEGSDFLSSGVGIAMEASSGGSTACDYHLSVIDFTT